MSGFPHGLPGSARMRGRATSVTLGRVSPSSVPEIVVAVEQLTKRFGSLTAVDGLSFSVGRGTVTGFLGPNGAGKTTTLRVILGLAAPTSGRALVLGRPYRHLDDAPHSVGAVLEASDFHPGRSGRDHLRALAVSAGIPTGRVEEVLALVELGPAAGRRVKGYSLGMRQRLGLAAALLGDPELLVLDEPANGLDPEGIRWLRDFLRGFASHGGSVLVSSHVLAEVAQTVDRVVIINHGRFVAEAALDEITARAASSVRVRSPQADELAALLRREGIGVTPAGDGLLAVAGASAERVGEIAAANRIVLHLLVTEESSLEEAFLALTHGEDRP
jgi:ABC-2 type transport system ATP-binding protein